MTEDIDSTKVNFTNFEFTDEQDKRLKEAMEAAAPNIPPSEIKITTNILNPFLEYKLEDVCGWEWINKPTGANPDKKELVVVYFHDRLAKKIITVEKIHKSENGIYIFADGYYQRQTKKYRPVDHIINIICQEDSYIHNEAKKKHFPLTQLPNKKITVSFLKEVNNSIENKLPQEMSSELFNIIPFDDKDNFVICVKNGLLKIATKEVMPFSCQAFLTNKTEVDYIDISKDEKLKPIYDEFVTYVKSMVADEKDYIRLQELLSVGLTKTPIVKTSLWLKGPSDSGKSTLNNIFKQVFGNKNSASISLHKLESDSSAASNLADKTINFSNDLGNAELKDLELFMNILGKDEMYTRQLYQEGNENTKLTMQLVVSLNDFPKGNFKYMNKFLNRIEIIMIKKVIKDKIRDYEKIWNTPERKSVILYWLVEGLHRLQNTGYSYPQSKEDKIGLINQESIEAFFNECLHYQFSTMENDIIMMNSEQILLLYNSRAEKNGLEQLDLSALHVRFNKYIKTNYPLTEPKKSDRTDKNTGKRYNIYNYKHLGPKDNAIIIEKPKSENLLETIAKLSYEEILLLKIKKAGNSGIRSEDLMFQLSNAGFNDAEKIRITIEYLLHSGKIDLFDTNRFIWLSDKIED